MNLYTVSKFLHSDQREGDYWASQPVVAKTPGAALDAVYPELELNRAYKVTLTVKNIKQASIAASIG